MTALVPAVVAGLPQRGRSTRGESDPGTGSASLIWHLFRRPGWLLGLLAGLLGLGVHVIALSIGRIATVQPLLVLELPVAGVASSRLFGIRLSRRDWLAVALLAVGLAAFLFSLYPQGGNPTAVSGPLWATGPAVVLGAAAVVAAVGWRSRQDLRAALLRSPLASGTARQRCCSPPRGRSPVRDLRRTARAVPY